MTDAPQTRTSTCSECGEPGHNRLRHLWTRRCPACDRPMRNGSGRYCSMACHLSVHGARDLALTCAHCGGEFVRHLGPGSKRVPRFCSRSCGSSATRPRTRTERTMACVTCGREFVRRLDPAQPDYKFCSRPCSGPYHAARPYKESAREAIRGKATEAWAARRRVPELEAEVARLTAENDELRRRLSFMGDRPSEGFDPSTLGEGGK